MLKWLQGDFYYCELTFIIILSQYINQFTAIMTTHVVIENVMYCAIMTTQVTIIDVYKDFDISIFKK